MPLIRFSKSDHQSVWFMKQIPWNNCSLIKCLPMDIVAGMRVSKVMIYAWQKSGAFWTFFLLYLTLDISAHLCLLHLSVISNISTLPQDLTIGQWRSTNYDCESTMNQISYIVLYFVRILLVNSNETNFKLRNKCWQKNQEVDCPPFRQCLKEND